MLSCLEKLRDQADTPEATEATRLSIQGSGSIPNSFQCPWGLDQKKKEAKQQWTEGDLPRAPERQCSEAPREGIPSGGGQLSPAGRKM